jgi:hypothetical protein
VKRVLVHGRGQVPTRRGTRGLQTDVWSLRRRGSKNPDEEKGGEAEPSTSKKPDGFFSSFWFDNQSEIGEYRGLYALTRMTTSTYHIFNRFRSLNVEKEWRGQVKPFNFDNLGYQAREENGKVIKFHAPLSKDPQKIIHESGFYSKK